MKQEQQLKQVQQETNNQVTKKDPKKVEAGRRLAAHNRKKREQKAQKSEVSQYYGIGAILVVGVIGGLGYYLYQAKKGEVKDVSMPCNPTVSQQPRPQNSKFGTN